MSYGLFNRYTPHTKFSFLKNKIILRKLASFKGGIHKSVINRKKAGIPMDHKVAHFLLSKMNIDNLGDLFKMSRKELKNLINNNEFNYLYFSFLQTEFFIRIFSNNKKYDDIKYEVEKILHSYN